MYAEIPDEVQDAVRRLRSGDKSGHRWIYQWMSEGARDRIDTWLVRTEHPLAYEPGTQEYRFVTVCEEIAKSAEVLK